MLHTSPARRTGALLAALLLAVVTFQQVVAVPLATATTARVLVA